MTATTPSEQGRSRATRTWLEAIRSQQLPDEFLTLLYEMSEDLELDRHWCGPDGSFSPRIEVRADLKRDVYLDRARQNVVIDDQLVCDVAELTVQCLINPTAGAFAALLLRNLCDHMLALGAFSVSQHIMRKAGAVLSDGAPPLVSVRRISSQGHGRIIEEVEVAVRAILVIHEIGHLIGFSLEAEHDHSMDPESREEIACDALAADLFEKFHERYSVVRYDPLEDDVYEDDGFPIAFGLYEFIMNATLLSRHIANVAQSLIGGCSDPDRHQHDFDFAKLRAATGASRLHASVQEIYTGVDDVLAKRSPELLQNEAAALIDWLAVDAGNSPKVWRDIDFSIDRASISHQREALTAVFEELCGTLGFTRWETLLLPDDVARASEERTLSNPALPEPRKYKGPVMPPGMEINDDLRNRIRVFVKSRTEAGTFRED